MFWKRNRRNEVGPVHTGGWQPPATPQFLIRFEDMLKGYFVTRNGEKIRQFCVYVDGASRLVTSGDVVDRDTMAALVEAGAVRDSLQPLPGTESARNLTVSTANE
jgi:hypothetical protein